MITLPKIIDFIANYLIKRSERKPDDVLAPEAEQSMLHRTYFLDGETTTLFKTKGQ